MIKQFIPKSTLSRLPLYLSYLRCLPLEERYISATAIAEGMGLNHVQVRKDLASVSSGGRPRIGYKTSELINDIQNFFGRGQMDGAVIVGMGPLGFALAQFEDFKAFGFNVIAAFDFDERIIGRRCGELEILPGRRLYDYCNAGGIRLGVITVDDANAQYICDTLTESGVLAIWNFSSVQLKTPKDVVVHNEGFIASLAIMSSHLKQF